MGKWINVVEILCKIKRKEKCVNKTKSEVQWNPNKNEFWINCEIGKLEIKVNIFRRWWRWPVGQTYWIKMLNNQLDD